jgi:hypothetical protein
MYAAGDEPGDVRHVDNHRGAHVPGHLRDACEIDHARIRTGAHHDHLWLVLVGETLELVVVNALVVLAHAIGNDRVELP